MKVDKLNVMVDIGFWWI